MKVQDAQRASNRINSKRNAPRHMVINMAIIRAQERNFKAGREKQQVTHKGLL